MGQTRDPDIPLLKWFKTQWKQIDKSQFQTGTDNETIFELIGDQKSAILGWAKMALEQQKQLWDDYQKVLEISIIVLGNAPSLGIHFQAPGPFQRARWMAKVIYLLKTWMFFGQFKLKKRRAELCAMSVFTVKVYLKMDRMRLMKLKWMKFT